MKPSALYLGIDLGTTNSAAALFDGTALTLVRSADGSNITPSVVRIDARGKITVGERARRFRDTDPENVRGEFKRLLGTDRTLAFAASKQALKPEALSAEVLRALREDVRLQAGFLPDFAVVTVPALFELPQTSATAEAARLAGFERIELLQEPVASAIAAGWRADSDDSAPWLVYDLGGGTFDVSLLETQDGLLRVVGHDGDNFLGGRDLDSAVVDWALAELFRETGVSIRRNDPAQALALRRLRNAAEEARIELTRAHEASLVVPGLPLGDGQTVDVDLILGRDTAEALISPLIERSIEVCQRLLTRHGLGGQRVARVVLVGGPTMTPLLRRRVEEALGSPAGGALDPMTLVAQGAALYAASAGLDAHPRPKTPAAAEDVAAGPRVWLQFPAMSSDLAPWVVGRVITDGGADGTAVTAVTLTRTDGAWQSNAEAVDAEGTFAIPVCLEPRRVNTFALSGTLKDGRNTPLSPARIDIVHGVTLGDPPLPRSVGVALANDGVQIFFERGSPLPMRRTHTLRTVETVSAGAAGYALDVPIVQGEFPLAHLCRLVGTLRIDAARVNATLPVGSVVEVTLELDRGGNLKASARLPALNQVFDEVARLVAPHIEVGELRNTLEMLRIRAQQARGNAFRSGVASAAMALQRVEPLLSELERDLDAAEGGEPDAAERARRTLMEVDALLASGEAERAWPDLIERARNTLQWAVGWVGMFGTELERDTLRDVSVALDKAIAARNAVEVSRQHALARQMGAAAFYRSPDAWNHELDWLDGQVATFADVPKARRLLSDARAAQGRGDRRAQEDACRELWKLRPVDAEERALGYGSGVR